MSQESQEHIETFEGCVFERRGLDISDWKGLVIFWTKMTAKINAASAWCYIGLMSRVISLLYLDNLADDHNKIDK